MKRDWDLILKILLDAERRADGRTPLFLEFDGYTASEVNYHVKLCEEAGYIETKGSQARICDTGERVEKVMRLTWNGHNELDRLRSRD